MEVGANDRDLLEDVMSHTGNLAEEEQGEDTGTGAEEAGHEGATADSQHAFQIPLAFHQFRWSRRGKGGLTIGSHSRC